VKRLLAFTAILAAAIAAAVWVHSCEGKEPATLTGRCVRVVDGDTLKVGTVSVRLAEIDAPEKAQPYGKESAAYLEALCLDRFVACEVIDTDMYGRLIAHVKVEGENRWVNDLAVENGFAHWYEGYSKDTELEAAQKLARSERRGLWKQSRVESPWAFRARTKRKATTN